LPGLGFGSITYEKPFGSVPVEGEGWEGSNVLVEVEAFEVEAFSFRRELRGEGRSRRTDG